MKFFILFLILYSCSSKNRMNNSGMEELEIVNENSIDKLFESHQLGAVAKKNSRRLASVTKKISNENFKDFSGVLTKKIGEYVIKKEYETLMLISFSMYGDFRYWRSIAWLNRSILSSPYKLRKGMKIKYYIPRREFIFNPEGVPFLIKQGHSLSKISDIVYENWKRWPEIYDNNKPLIKNPNKIYAGFTLYYIEDEENIDITKNYKLNAPARESRQKNKLLAKVLKNIKRERRDNQEGQLVPDSINLFREKISTNRMPSSKQVKPLKKLTNKEVGILSKIKKAVKIDEKRQKNEKSQGSLIDKVKKSFKQFDYY